MSQDTVALSPRSPGLDWSLCSTLMICDKYIDSDALRALFTEFDIAIVALSPKSFTWKPQQSILRNPSEYSERQWINPLAFLKHDSLAGISIPLHRKNSGSSGWVCRRLCDSYLSLSILSELFAT